jgi:hypothetical protein
VPDGALIDSWNPGSIGPPVRLNVGATTYRLSIQSTRPRIQPFIQSNSSCHVFAMYQLGQTYTPRIGQRWKFLTCASERSQA